MPAQVWRFESPVIKKIGDAGAKAEIPRGIGTVKNTAYFGGVPLTDLVAYAYRVKPFQVWGSSWMDTAYFDVSGIIPANSSPDRMPEMMQSLLRDYFRLNAHQDQANIELYALIPDNGGAKLTSAPHGYAPSAHASSAAVLPVSTYATLLGKAIGKPVEDNTGLRGEYLFPIHDLALAASGNRRLFSPSDPELQDALHSQGLKLDARKQRLPVIVIDYIERVADQK